MTNICSKCGFEPPLQAVFCPKCGNAIQAPTTPVPTPATPEETGTSNIPDSTAPIAPSKPAHSMGQTMMYAADMMDHVHSAVERHEVEGNLEEEHTLRIPAPNKAPEQEASASGPASRSFFETPPAPNEVSSPPEQKDAANGTSDHTAPSGEKKRASAPNGAETEAAIQQKVEEKASQEASQTGDFASTQNSPWDPPATPAPSSQSPAPTPPPSTTSRRPALNQTVVFGAEMLSALDAVAEQAEQANALEKLSGGKLQTSFPTTKTEAFLTPFASDSSTSQAKTPKTTKPKKKGTSKRSASPMNQTMAIGDIAAQMAEMAKLSASEPKASRTHNKTLAMETQELQQWIQEVGVDPENAPGTDAKDATEIETRAEQAVKDGKLDSAVELYLELLRSFPQERRYQTRLENLWLMMRERAQDAVGQAESRVLAHSTKEKKRLHLFWGGGVGIGLLFLLLGLVWPGWLRTSSPSLQQTKRSKNASSAQTQATIQMNSTPMGASVWINGENTEKRTPFSMKTTPGSYEIVLKLKGYRSLKKKVKLQPNQLFAIEFALAPDTQEPSQPVLSPVRPPRRRRSRHRQVARTSNRTKVRSQTKTHRKKISFLIRSKPSGALISIDDRKTNKRTPARFRLRKGHYQLQLQRNKYQTYIRDIFVHSRRRGVTIRLLKTTPSQSKLSLVSRPSGAAINIDGKDTGKQTPTILNLPTTPVAITLSKDGYRDKKKKIQLKAGETRRLVVRLRKKGPKNMVYISSGPFWMGNNAGVSREKPMRRVSVSGFWIDRSEVKVKDYEACVTAGKCRKVPKKSGCNHGSSKAEHPVNCVRWYDANKYCRWKNKHLPSEAQWEKAARGKTTQLYPWGHSSPSCRYAIFNQQCGHSGTFPTGSRPRGRSPYGINDMSGNVWEWVRDYFDRNYYHKASDQNPYNQNRGGGYRVIRGGAWNTPSGNLHVTYRLEYWPARFSKTIGFRCAK